MTVKKLRPVKDASHKDRVQAAIEHVIEVHKETLHKLAESDRIDKETATPELERIVKAEPAAQPTQKLVMLGGDEEAGGVCKPGEECW